MGTFALQTNGAVACTACLALLCLQGTSCSRGAEAPKQAAAKAVTGLTADIAAACDAEGRVAPEKAPELQKRLAALAGQEALLAKPLGYYRILCLASTDPKEAAKALETALAGKFDAPELLLLNLRLAGEDQGADRYAKIRAVHDSLGAILPASMPGRDLDHKKGRPWGKIDPPPPQVPALDAGKMADIAAQLISAGMVREGIDAYLEAAYAGVPLESKDREAAVWFAVAEAERGCGQRELAIAAYQRSVFRNPGGADKAAAGIGQCLDGVGAAGAAPAPADAAGRAMEAARAYGKLNMHPYGLRILKKLGDDQAGEKAKLTAELDAQWKALLGKLTPLGGPQTHVLGLKVADVADWAAASIARPSTTFWTPTAAPAAK